jgi:hypothetical protein
MRHFFNENTDRVGESYDTSKLTTLLDKLIAEAAHINRLIHQERE